MNDWGPVKSRHRVAGIVLHAGYRLVVQARKSGESVHYYFHPDDVEQVEIITGEWISPDPLDPDALRDALEIEEDE